MIDNFRFNVFCYKRGKEKNNLVPVHFYRDMKEEKALNYYFSCIKSHLFSSIVFLEYNSCKDCYFIRYITSGYTGTAVKVTDVEFDINQILKKYDQHMFYKNEIKE